MTKTEVGALYVVTDAWGTYFVVITAVRPHDIVCQVFVTAGYRGYDGPLTYDYTTLPAFLSHMTRLG